MKIKKLSLKNIRSYKSEEIVFPEGSMLLSGDVGSGKTSVLLAIEYSLFGIQPGQRGASLLRNGSTQGSVSLEFEVGGKAIKIERKLKRNNKTVTNEYASITINGEKKEASLTEIKSIILDLIGYPKEIVKKNNLLYRYTVYTPQEQMKEIILEDAETRLNILRHILGVDKHKRIRENLVIVLNQLKEECKILQVEVRNIDEEKSRLESKKDSLKIIDDEISVRFNELQLKINDRKKIEIEELRLKDKINEKEYLEKEIEKSRIMVANKYENLSTVENEMHELERTIAEVGDSFNEVEYQSIIAKLNQKRESIEDLNIQYTNLLTEVNALEKQQKDNLIKKERMFKIEICPTCLQDVPEVHKHNILNETENVLSKSKQKIAFLEDEIIRLTKTIDAAKSEKRSLEDQKTIKDILRARLEYTEKTKKRLFYLMNMRSSHGRDLDLLHTHISHLKEKILELTKFDNMARLKKRELQRVLEEERKCEISLAEAKKELELTKREIAEREQLLLIKEKFKLDLKEKLELNDWLSNSFLELIEFTERNVLLKLRHEFSKAFSKWFHMLVQQSSLSVRLDESFSPIILNNEVEMEYSFLSGGERTAVALAYRLALNQTINSVLSKIRTKDIVILDEPTDGFSEFQLDRIREVLQELNINQLIIVSHEQKIESFVDNIIKIKKVNNVSYLDASTELPQNSSSKEENDHIDSREITFQIPAVLYD